LTIHPWIACGLFLVCTQICSAKTARALKGGFSVDFCAGRRTEGISLTEVVLYRTARALRAESGEKLKVVPNRYSLPNRNFKKSESFS